MSGWDWPGLAALAVSVVALVLSWLAYRQRIKYHAQPKLVASWERDPLGHYEVPVRQVRITNYGDAVARDLTVAIPSSARGGAPWDKRVELLPGDTWSVMVPLVSGADWRQGGMQMTFRVVRGGGADERPKLVLAWRQSPFADRKRRLTVRAPRLVGSSSQETRGV